MIGTMTCTVSRPVLPIWAEIRPLSSGTVSFNEFEYEGNAEMKESSLIELFNVNTKIPYQKRMTHLLAIGTSCRDSASVQKYVA